MTRNTAWTVLLAAAWAASCVSVATAGDYGTRRATARAPTRSRPSRPNGSHVLAVGGRVHADFSDETVHPPHDLPVGGDTSYGIAYEYHERQGAWQFALNYAPENSVLLPQFGLLVQDRGLEIGIGGIAGYLLDNEDETTDDWSGILWQISTGFHLSGGSKLSLDLIASYVFAAWNDFDVFDFDALDYGLWLKFPM